MGTRRDAPRKTRRGAPIAAGPLRHNHKAALKKFWDERPCLPSVTSRKAWASARGIEPACVNRWFYAQVQKAKASGFELDTENEGYDLDVEEGSPSGSLTLTWPPSEGYSVPRSTTPGGPLELSCYEYSTSCETGLRILLTPGRPSSSIFGSSFYSPKLALDSPFGAYSHLLGVEQFIFTPPSPPKREQTTQSRSHSQHVAGGTQGRIHRSTYPLPISPKPNNCPPPVPLAPRKLRPSRGSHDILNFHVQDDPFLRFSPPISSPTPMASGYSVPCHADPQTYEGDDKPNLSSLSDPRVIDPKTSRLTDQKRGGYNSDDLSLNHRDDQTMPPSPKCLWMISLLCVITQTVCPFQLSVSSISIKTCIDRTAHLPSLAKHRWLHRAHRRPTHTS